MIGSEVDAPTITSMGEPATILCGAVMVATTCGALTVTMSCGDFTVPTAWTAEPDGTQYTVAEAPTLT
jgi:hypothetical protein